MSKRDLIHDAVKEGLEKEGWIITNDPLQLRTGGTTFRMDLGAEKVIIAEKGKVKIAVEIKSFTNISLVYDFYEAFGQYMFYRDALIDKSIDRQVYLAISKSTWKRIQTIPFLLKRINQYQIKIIVFDIYKNKLIEWIE